MNIKENWQKYSHIHVWWIIAWLISTVIFLLAFKTENQSEIKDIINTSLALASLLLALVAIIQALLAGSEMNVIASSIRSHIDEIRRPAEKLLEASNVLNAYSERITHSTLELSKRIECINLVNTENQGGLDQGLQSTFYITAGGTLALLICYLSSSQNKSFNVDSILDKESISHGKYLSGYITGFISSLKTSAAMTFVATNENFQVSDLKGFAERAGNAGQEIVEPFVVYKNIILAYFEHQSETM